MREIGIFVSFLRALVRELEVQAIVNSDLRILDLGILNQHS